MKKIFIAVVLMLGLTGCRDIFDSSDNPIIYGPTDDHMEESVKANLPTAVLSQFDETSMGAALVRRLSNTTSEIQPNTKMVLIKGEDILSRPMTEWLEAAKIYLMGGYIAIEKPHDAHLVHFMEQLSDKFEQATREILTADDGSGITVKIVPSDNQSLGKTINADAAKMDTRIANIKALAATRGDAGDNAQPVAEMVIFSCKGYYQCAPFQNRVVGSSMSNSEEEKEKVLNREYNSRSSGLMADGAALWLNSRQKSVAGARAMTRADGNSSINQLMSASEEHTFQQNLWAKNMWGEESVKENAYLETIRIWGCHNIETNKDYYYVQQKAVASVGGKQDGDARSDPNKTLYYGPYGDRYESGTWHFHHDDTGEDEWTSYLYYGAWFQEGEFHLGLSGKGDIKVEDAIPTTDNNNTSTAIAVGETHTETNTIGFSLSAIISASPGANLGFNYSHGWTDGTTYTMTTTTNVKEIKVTKNTEGNQVIWKYANSLNVRDKSSEKKHVLVPDAVISDVNIDNQVCWSVSNPEGEYTLETYRRPKMQILVYNLFKENLYTDNSWYKKSDASYTLRTPNRAKQTWRMDIDFPELGQPGHEGQKGQLTQYLQTQFPDIYQPTIELADQTPDSENTITYLVNISKQMLSDPNARETLVGYAKDLGISQYTIKWYCMDGNHNTYEAPVTVE